VAKTRRRPPRKTGSPRRPSKKPVKARPRAAPAKPTPLGPRKLPYNATFLAFLQANPRFYVGSFAQGGNALPKGVTLARLVRHSMKQLAVGKWAAATVKKGNATAVFVAFADKADFDNVKAHHGGKPWTSPVPGATDAFSV
jgi:hypothetical protein